MSCILNSSTDSEYLLSLIKRCMQDLSSILFQITNENKSLLLPFDYHVLIKYNSSSGSSLYNHSHLCDNLEKNSPVNPTGFYNTNKVDFNVEANDDIDLISSYKSSAPTSTQSTSSVDFFYYQNCVVEVLLKLFAKTIGDKFALAKYLIEDLMPTNSNLIRVFVAYSIKLNGMHQTLQSLYDHLIINSIDNQRLWVL